ncbi:hypothetical protein [Novosphingobium rosa]|uniref:hypothetical protein n=1 Tax=Novosphingobium rosa TaxID=76978 RepID=UPI000831C114|nr:hypothetical protein [Novosphingobium rosa]
MPTHNLIQNFNGGAVSKRLHGRTDAAIYDIALSEMVNFAPTVEGPALKRSGSIIAAEAAPTASNLMPFEFNSKQAYVLEFGNGQVRFYSNSGALIVDGVGAPIVLAVPYALADVPQIDYQQSADVLYLAHPNYPFAKISRVGAAAFTYETVTLSGGPFQDQNSDRTITIASEGGTVVGNVVTLTASSPIFLPGHIGGLIQLQAVDFEPFPLWEPGMHSGTGNAWRWEGQIYQNVDGTITGQTPPTHTYGIAQDGSRTTDVNGNAYGVAWKYLCDQYGQLQITATGNASGASNTATATIVRALTPDMTTPDRATWRWSFGRFSAQNGYPKLVKIWNNRIVLFTDFEVMGSVVGDYYNYSAFDDTGRQDADLAFRFRITGANPINWAVVDLQLLLSTDRAEWTMGSLNAQTGPSATNMQITRQSTYGSVQIRPMQIGLRTIFVQRGGRKLRSAGYEYTQNRYTAPNLAVWCRNLVQVGIQRLAYQQESEETLWALRTDGRLLMHAESADQQVKGFAQANIAGFAGADAVVLDICCIPAPAGAPDMLWMLVQRGNLKTVEYLADWWTDEAPITDARFLDGSIIYSGAQATVIGTGGTGFPTSWAGQSVAGLLDGQYATGLVIASDGSVTLPFAASNVVLGLFYLSWMVGLPSKLPARSGGFLELLKRRMKAVVMRVVDAGAVWFGSQGASRLEEIFRRQASTPMDTASPLAQGSSDEITAGGNTDRDGQWRLESRAPLPATISMVRSFFQPEDKD